MSLNNISLPAQLIADLYEFSLIEREPALSTPEAIKFLGKNEKKILILVSKDNVAFVEDEELDFLSSILLACKLSLTDVAVINLKNFGDTDYHYLIDQLKTKKIILFDVEAQTIDLPFNFPKFQLQQFDQAVYLSAPSLKEIQKEKTLKTELWNCLKNLFGL
jgi:hypothetical protein